MLTPRKVKKAILARPCPRCQSTRTRQLTNYAIPMPGRYQCFACRRTWDETIGHETYPDHVSKITPITIVEGN